MEILLSNLLQTSTQLTVNSNTATAENVINPDVTYQYYSDGFNNDLTSSVMTIAFDVTTTISRIALMGHNLKDYIVYYNGATANTLAMTSTGATTVSSFTSNSETSQYFRFTAVDVTSVSIQMNKTLIANDEKAIGYFLISDLDYELERVPSADNYSPKLDTKQIVHTMSDGGTRIHTLSKKKSATIKYKNISETFRNNLKTIYDAQTSFVFCPFGTTTGWDKFIMDCVWAGAFDFYKFSDDASVAGYSGTISLKETSY